VDDAAVVVDEGDEVDLAGLVGPVRMRQVQEMTHVALPAVVAVGRFKAPEGRPALAAEHGLAAVARPHQMLRQGGSPEQPRWNYAGLLQGVNDLLHAALRHFPPGSDGVLQNLRCDDTALAGIVPHLGFQPVEAGMPVGGAPTLQGANADPGLVAVWN